MRNALLILAVALASLASLLLIRTVQLVPQQVEADPAMDVVVDVQAVTGHLAQAIRFPTISTQDPDKTDPQAFRRFHHYLERIFPRTHQVLKKKTVREHSLLFTWQGSEEGLKPILFLAHLDVVPVEAGTAALWSYPPFAGEVAGGYIWGRGALDDKVRVLATLEAVEKLLAEGFSPRRTLVFAFGHDEEVGGHRGAASIAALLKERGLEFEYVLDEGGFIAQGMFPGVSKPIALVGIAEKGYVSLEQAVKSDGGHSSMPPRQTAIGILSSAIHRLEEQQLPSRIEGPAHQLFEVLATEMPFGKRIVLANLWLFGSLVQRELAAAPSTNALIRTTIAPTMIYGGVKENVLPAQARAVVNLRLLPGDTIEGTIRQVGQIIDDPRVRIRPLGHPHEPSAVSGIETWGFVMLARTIHQIYGDVLVAPYLIPFTTDARHYAELSANIFRLTPVSVVPADLRRVHGTDERIAVEQYVQAVKFYHQLIRNTDLS